MQGLARPQSELILVVLQEDAYAIRQLGTSLKPQRTGDADGFGGFGAFARGANAEQKARRIAGRHLGTTTSSAARSDETSFTQRASYHGDGRFWIASRLSGNADEI